MLVSVTHVADKLLLHLEIENIKSNPLLMNGLSQRYHLDESTFIFRGIASNFSFLFHFSMKIKIANRVAQDGTPRFTFYIINQVSNFNFYIAWLVFLIFLIIKSDIIAKMPKFPFLTSWR